jgi:hypothetical protein
MLPASMNHNEPQLVETPTRRAASAPLWPSRRSSKYRFFTEVGILLCAQRGIRTSLLEILATTLRTQGVYPVVFIDAVVVKFRDGQVANRPCYTAIGVTVDGKRDILGLWIGQGGEGAKYWLQVLTEIKNRGVEDVWIVVCDGVEGSR